MQPVHTLLVFSSLLTVMGGSALLLTLLHRVHEWSWRRKTHVLVLMLPLLVFLLGLGLLHYLLVRLCAHAFPSWEMILDYTLPFCISLVGVGAFGLGGIRLWLFQRFLRHQQISVSADVQRMVDTLAERCSLKHCRILLCTHAHPLALTYGLFRPTILLSTWMLEHLDYYELEAVLAHELQHVTQRDYLVILLATCLRDAFFYLPTSRIAYHQLQQEKELMCDDRAAQKTQRPLALASALTKVWLQALHAPPSITWSIAPSFLDGHAMMDKRIERLLHPGGITMRPPSRIFAFSTGLVMLTGLAMFQSFNLMVTLQIAGCNPVAFLEKLW